LYEWKKDNKDEYPQILLVASPNMKNNYEKYGDMVSFVIAENLLINTTFDGYRYRVGMFCVTDTNARVLIVAIAIFCQDTPANMYKVFEYFIRIHGRTPQTFITDEH
jgi:hypothetical protein